MRTEYLKYKDYKKIDHILLEGMPTGWELKKIKFVGNVKMGQSPKSEDCNKLGNGIPFLQGNADFGVISPTATTYCETANKVSLDGDILFSVRAPVGALNISDKQYGIGRGLCSLTASNIQSRFLWFALQVYRLELKSLATGSTYDAISIDEVSNIKILVPSTHEQTQIASFLDQKTAQIDKLIAQKEKLLKLLAEKRTAIITQAVTKGLDPNVEMKDSGIDWLGDIPKHWAVKKIKFITSKVKTGTTPSSNGVDYFTDGAVNWYNRSDFSYDSIELYSSKRKIQDLFFEETNLSKYPKDSVLIVGIGATLGKVGVSILDSYSNQQINAILPTDKYSSYFLAYVLSSLVDVLKVYSNSTTLGIMNQEKTKNFTIPYPSITEQTQIVKYIKQIDKKIESVIEKTKSSIKQLKEYREALITAAVTGQIDVRKEASHE